jgi:hypothetical protein
MNSQEHNSDKAQRALQFERYVIALLRAQATEQGKTLLSGNEISRELAFADALAPLGLFDLQGPVIIEIKIRYSERVLELFRRIRKHFSEPANFILIFQEGGVPQNRMRDIFEQKSPTSTILIWGKDELAKLAKQYPDAALAFNSAYLEPAIDRFKARDEQKSQDQHLTALRTAYNNDKLALFLGAGVSKSATFPDWNELVKRISLMLLDESLETPISEKEKEDIYQYFQSESPSSPIIVTRLLQNSYKDKFPERVRKVLYSGSRKANSSWLLREIGALCMPRRDRIGITSVVNYNFDDLLETELERRDIPYRTVLSDNDEPLKSELPIYHVHGFLPRTGSLSNAHRQSLVFSEDAYHQQFHDPYLWTNITQLNLLRNDVCLFIGLSLTDPNQRRLLEITNSKKPGMRHYAVLRDHWLGRKFSSLSESGQLLTKVFKGLEESSFSNLGISVLWVNTFDDIAPLLEQIRSE